MKPFNLQEALAGKPVVDGYGSPVTELHYFETVSSKQRLVAVVAGEADSFSDNGQFLDDRASKNDLFMASEKKEGWVNIYDPGEEEDYLLGFLSYDGRFATHIFKTEEEARRHAINYPAIATVRIEWEE